MHSIVRRPWDFACQWYGVDEIYQAINREERLKHPGDVPRVPTDVKSREFAEWLAEQYRLAMRKGAELATSEQQTKIDELEDNLSVTIGALRRSSEQSVMFRQLLLRLSYATVPSNSKLWQEIRAALSEDQDD